MSKVRREKHKDLVLYQIFEKQVDKYKPYNNKPRWRQSARSSFEQFIKELKQ